MAIKVVPVEPVALAKVGVELIHARPRWMLRCMDCGMTWEVPCGPAGRPWNFWRCPTGWGCNYETEEVSHGH